MDLSTFTLVLFSTTLLLFSCASTNQDKTIEQIADEIDELVGNAEADTIEQCAFMPIGVKPAGGPWGYLVYSTKDTDRTELEDLVNDYNELDAERNQESDAFSTADFATEPSLKIQDGSCIGEGQYAWNPGEVRENT
ncbi:hypothetical protein [Rhodohalobacter sp.]|uniref:hypothetical protein n=1 Tax=Rhodohalobacter sp. TaxID=1974210 RepID=UPI002ACEF81E|nr:hypothetical protein [Rhodohalobacter sp.]MDZ7757879.1 hypothetical protein [Rhodohalobacter sp.]